MKGLGGRRKEKGTIDKDEGKAIAVGFLTI